MKTTTEAKKFIQVSDEVWQHPNGYEIHKCTNIIYENHIGKEVEFYDLRDPNRFSCYDFETFEMAVSAMIDNIKANKEINKNL